MLNHVRSKRIATAAWYLPTPALNLTQLETYFPADTTALQRLIMCRIYKSRITYPVLPPIRAAVPHSCSTLSINHILMNRSASFHVHFQHPSKRTFRQCRSDCLSLHSSPSASPQTYATSPTAKLAKMSHATPMPSSLNVAAPVQPVFPTASAPSKPPTTQAQPTHAAPARTRAGQVHYVHSNAS
jgi:hypothetical protein